MNVYKSDFLVAFEAIKRSDIFFSNQKLAIIQTT